MTLEQYLIQLGLETFAGVLSGAVNTLLKKKEFTQDELRNVISSFKIQNADIYAQNIISFLAKQGDITIQGTKIHSEKAVHMASGLGTKFTLENNSVSSTPLSKIEVGFGASIQAQNGAGIRQNEDGSISFFA